MTASRDAANQWKQALWQAVDQQRDRWLDLLAETIRRPSDNPPGDTTAVAAYLRDVLTRAGIQVDVYEPLEKAPNLVAFLPQRGGGRKLILNGHLDQFPVERPEIWTGSPYSGEVRGDRIYGRGAADMKGGTVALVAVMLLLAELRVPLAGEAVLTLVSDEETGGRWGAQWLLENVPAVMGDAVLNSEPSSPDAIVVAEKGICWLRVTTHSPGGHSGLSPLDNANFKMAAAIRAGLRLRGKQGQVPEELRGALETSRALIEAEPNGRGAGWVLDSVSLNVGTLQGGVKANVVPERCVAEFDFRLPVGIDPNDFIAEFVEALQDEGLGDEDVTVEPILVQPPSHTLPGEEIVQVVAANAEAVTGRRPHFHFLYGGTDCRFWRFKGVPAAIFGPRSHNMAAADENILVEDYLTTIKVHGASVIDYLTVERGPAS